MYKDTFVIKLTDMNRLRTEYNHLTLIELSEKLHMDYYDLIVSMVSAAEKKLAELKMLDINGVTAAYTDACNILLIKVRSYLQYQKQALHPYINELFHKETTGHNCGNCSGGCEMGHAAHIITLRDMHISVMNMLHQLQLSALSMYAEGFEYTVLYKALRQEMQLIDTIIRELIYVEETYLLSNIIKAQKTINVLR